MSAVFSRQDGQCYDEGSMPNPINCHRRADVYKITFVWEALDFLQESYRCTTRPFQLGRPYYQLKVEAVIVSAAEIRTGLDRSQYY